jgi:hypothetical protein
MSGFVIYSIVGYFVFNDWLWLVHQNPYHGQSSYGHGPLLHFVKHSAATTGIAMACAFCGGLLYMVYRFFKVEGLERRYAAIEFILVFIGSAAFIAAHSYLWWKGIMNSAGMLRVVAGIIPLVAVGAIRGAEGLISLVKLPNRYAHIFLAISTLAIWNHTFHRHAYRPKMPTGIKAVKEATDFVKTLGVKNDLIYVTNPKAMVFLDLDPFGSRKSPELYLLWDKQHPEKELSSGSVLIWDTFFGPSTGVALEPFLRSGEFEVLRRYHSAPGIKPGEWEYYEQVVMMRK